MRAFFFALGYLGWFISPWLLIATSVIVAVILWRRQFGSDSRRALIGDDDTPSTNASPGRVRARRCSLRLVERTL